MKIELKNTKHFPSMSEETEAFSASLYVDGKKIGDVSNHGTGGCDEFRGDYAAYQAADNWCRTNLPKTVILDEEDDTTLEYHIADLLSDFIDGKHMKSVLRKKVIYALPSKEGLFQLAYKDKSKPDAKLINHVKAIYPGAVTLNELPHIEALKRWRENMQ